MFAARGGFVNAAVSGTPQWYNMTTTQISNEVATWVSTGTRTLSNSVALGNVIWSTNDAYRAAVAFPTNGNVYMCPSAKGANTILEIDPRTLSAREVNTNLNLRAVSTNNFVGGCLGDDGKIYWPPYDHNKVLVADPANSSYSLQDWGISLSTKKYFTAVAANNKVYAIGQTDMLVIDTAANTAFTSTYGVLSGTTANRHIAGVRSIKDGNVYFGPYANTHYLRMDITANVLSSNTYGQPAISQNTQGAANGKNGNVYFTNYLTSSGRSIRVLDPASNTMSNLALNSAVRSIGGCMGPDGNVYAAFQASGNSTFIDVTTGNVVAGPSYLPGTTARGGMLFVNNKLLTVPSANTNTHITITTVPGTGDSGDFSANIQLSSFMNMEG
jgi:hypothetical protein